MKILWIGTTTSPDAARLENTAAFLKKYSFPGTEIVLRKVERGTESIESRLDEVYASLPIVDEVLKAEREGFDACIVGCAGDAGVAVAKEVAKIPVIGPGEASILISRLVGERVVFVTTLLERIPSVEERVARLIPSGKYFIYPCNIPVLEIPKNPDRTIAILSEIIERSKKEDRADTAILACLSMRGMAETVQGKVQIPVIDPAIAALGMAQSIVRLNISQAKGAYPFPPNKKRYL